METVPENTHANPELKRIFFTNQSNYIHGFGTTFSLKGIEFGTISDSSKIIGGIRNPNFVITKKTSIITQKTNAITEKTIAITEKRRSNIGGLTINNKKRTIIIDWNAILRGRKACNIELNEGKIRQHISVSKKEKGISKQQINSSEKE